MRLRRGTCTVADCDGTLNARGMCSGHYGRWRRTGDPQPHVPLNRRSNAGLCRVEGCGRDRHRRELCNTHYTRLRQTGDLQADEPILTTAERTAERNRAAAFAPGARRLTDAGYWLVKLALDDPLRAMANQSANQDWVLEHRIVMARSVGRPLAETETVHHVNGVRTDNRLENLELWASRHPRGSRRDDPHCPTCTCQAGQP